MEQNMFIRILNSEMELATGCTEPGAVALTAAEAGQALRKAGVDKAEEITVNASINIIKNAMSAGIPGTDYEGMDYAAAIGALGGDPVYLLEVMNHVPRETVESAAALVKAGKVRVNVAQVPQKLYIEVIAKGGGHTGHAIVRDLHTNVVLVEQDGVATLDKRDTDTAAAGDSDVVSPEQIASFLTVRSIWDYCTKELDPMNDPIDIIRSAVKVNSVISDEGLSKEYGLAIGRNLDLNCRKGLMTRDLTTNSMIAAAAAQTPVCRRSSVGGGKLRQRQSGHHCDDARRGCCPLAGHRRAHHAACRHPVEPHRHPHQVEVWPSEQPVRRHRRRDWRGLRHYIPAGRRLP